MSCSCVKAGRPCTDCLPSRKGHCCNVAPSPAPAMTSSMTTADNGHGLSLALTGDTPESMGNDVFYSQDTPCSTSPGSDANTSAMFDDVITDINTDTLVETRTLPSFEPVPSVTSSWRDISGEKFSKAIDDAYTEVVHWKHTFFKVPSGAWGKQFVTELTRLFNSFATESDLEAIALKAAITLPSLMLQKPHAKSKTHDHISCLQRRLSLWEKGDI